MANVSPYDPSVIPGTAADFWGQFGIATGATGLPGGLTPTAPQPIPAGGDPVGVQSSGLSAGGPATGAPQAMAWMNGPSGSGLQSAGFSSASAAPPMGTWGQNLSTLGGAMSASPSRMGAASLGEQRTINGQPAQWDGTGWLALGGQ